MYYLYLDQKFVWDSEKSSTNIRKHRVDFKTATQVFFDRLIYVEDSSVPEETRDAAIGMTDESKLLLWFTSNMKTAPFASFPRGKPLESSSEPMKTASERLRERLRKDRPMTVISLRMPEDVIEELKEMAPALGCSGYQPLIRHYIGQGMRRDAARLANSQAILLTERLRRQGISDEVISIALAEAKLTVVSAIADDDVAISS